MLIGEVPIIGNRFSEIVKPKRDAAELALASEKTVFIYPVPTREVRERLEASRKATFARPRHPSEARDAPPAAMDLAWKLTCAKAIELNLVSAGDFCERATYTETVYRRFFDHLLQHRNSRVIKVDTLHSEDGSAHDLKGNASEIFATADEAATAIACVEAAMTEGKAAWEVGNWHCT